MNPFLRWAGSKRKLLPHLQTRWGTGFDRYVEPFMGSACLFFAVEPRAALLADTNNALVDTFKTVRDHPLDVYHQLNKFLICEETYYAIRDDTMPTADPVIRAARFIYLNRFCFNGIYRTNMRGKFNVPYSGKATGNLPSFHELQATSSALKRAQLSNADFGDTLDQVRKGDFVYLDPPYSVENRRVFKQYGPAIFGTSDLKRLADHLIEIDRRGAKFLLSYACCKEALESFGRWKLNRRMTNRNIAGFAKHRRNAIELMFSNCTGEN